MNETMTEEAMSETLITTEATKAEEVMEGTEEATKGTLIMTEEAMTAIVAEAMVEATTKAEVMHKVTTKDEEVP